MTDTNRNTTLFLLTLLLLMVMYLNKSQTNSQKACYTSFLQTLDPNVNVQISNQEPKKSTCKNMFLHGKWQNFSFQGFKTNSPQNNFSVNKQFARSDKTHLPIQRYSGTWEPESNCEIRKFDETSSKKCIQKHGQIIFVGDSRTRMLALATNELLGTLEQTREYRKSDSSDYEPPVNGKDDQTLLLGEAIRNNKFLDEVTGYEIYYSRYFFSQVLGEHDMNMGEDYELLGHVGITMDLMHKNEMGIYAGLLVVGDQLLHPIMQFAHKYTDQNNLTVEKFTRDNVIPKIENSTLWVRNNLIDKVYELIPKMIRLLKKNENLKIVFMGAHLSLRSPDIYKHVVAYTDAYNYYMNEFVDYFDHDRVFFGKVQHDIAIAPNGYLLLGDITHLGYYKEDFVIGQGSWNSLEVLTQMFFNVLCPDKGSEKACCT